MQRHAVILQAAYSELLQMLGDALVAEFPLGGTFVKKEQKGRPYWYFAEKQAGGLRHRYLGPQTPELLARIAADRPRLADARRLRARRRELVRVLLAGGYTGTGALSGRILQSLAAAGAFRLRATLVGTHAFRCYEGLLGHRLPARAALTSDNDVAQFPTVSVAVDDHIDAPVETLLKAIDNRLRAVERLDPRESHAEWHLREENATVELLAPLVGPSDDKLRPLPALKGHGKPMRFLDFLIFEADFAVVLYDSGVLVRVPTPTRYALHKLIVSQRRVEARGVDAAKAPKDLAQADALLTVLLADRRSEVEDTWRELLGRGRKWQRYALNALPGLSPGNAAALKSLG